MKIEKIKHRLLIDNMWETLILKDNTARVFVQRTRLYSKDEYFEESRNKIMPLTKIQFNQLDAIFNKDWSDYK